MNTATTRTAAETATINKVISAAILLEINNGANPAAALDAVLGAGTYDKLVSDLYDALRAKGRK